MKTFRGWGMVETIRQRLEQELNTVIVRLRQWGEGVAVEIRPGTTGTNVPFADEVDEIQASAGREIGFATRELLVERVKHLTAALDRLADGEYGICADCGETISPARLRAMPEVKTCVRCQDRLERLGRRAARERMELQLTNEEDSDAKQ
jgi:RNA polymerase-binding transcription factor